MKLWQYEDNVETQFKFKFGGNQFMESWLSALELVKISYIWG